MLPPLVFPAQTLDQPKTRLAYYVSASSTKEESFVASRRHLDELSRKRRVLRLPDSEVGGGLVDVLLLLDVLLDD
jgi:hypothetical protein